MIDEMSEWQPIETAPKDGAFILLAIPDHQFPQIGAWVAHRDSSYPYAWKDQGGSILARGWKDDPEPTHWMPLPSPPATA